jgi:hypothetical protein
MEITSNRYARMLLCKRVDWMKTVPLELELRDRVCVSRGNLADPLLAFSLREKGPDQEEKRTPSI